MTCTDCGRAYFPPISIGCEVCGAPQARLEPLELAAVGIVRAMATVHVARHPDPPFTVAEILLDGGPLIRALIHPESAAVRIDDRVTARWRATGMDQAGNRTVEPGFVLCENEEQQ
ncbi:Zn-ribbon domain-containing OB-fold protein [Nocardia acididurans]|uniref:Zn-ribbon domain-containing OB-fold protein n=1 Tax=Nocardia acididurans TaxID=2802282 RepID=UPI001E5045A1|nr:zinc ribbon domain-containing protein [Nocardia acididurans]